MRMSFIITVIMTTQLKNLAKSKSDYGNDLVQLFDGHLTQIFLNQSGRDELTFKNNIAD
jgi:hypothetical protein